MGQLEDRGTALPVGPANGAAASGLSLVVGLLAVAGVLAAVIFSVRFPPLADLPNHAGRIWVHATGATDALIGRYYAPHWAYQPNLMFDALGKLILPWLDIYATSKVIALLAAMSLIVGTMALHRVLHGRLSLVPLLACLFVIDRAFVWGFLSNVFTLGLALGALAAWIALRRSPGWQMAVGTLAAFVLFLGHLHPYGVYAVAVFGYEAQRSLAQPIAAWPRGAVRGAVRMLHLLPPAVLFVLFSPTRSTARHIDFNSLGEKVESLNWLVPGYDVPYEALLLTGAAALVGLAVALGWIRLRRELALAFLLLCACFLVLPYQMFHSWFADSRVLIVLPFILIASLDWGARGGAAARYGLVAGIAALFLLQQKHVYDEWQRTRPVLDGIIGLTRHVERGAKMVSIYIICGPSNLASPTLGETSAFFLIERSAFTPHLFSYPVDPSIPVRYQEPYAALAQRDQLHWYTKDCDNPPPDIRKRLADRVDWILKRDFAYLLLMINGPVQFPLPARFRLVEHTPQAWLYRIQPAAP